MAATRFEGGVRYVSRLYDWKQATGNYLGEDASTYFVTNDSGLVMVFAVGGTVGRGSTTRTISQRGTRLVVGALYGGESPLPELVLEPGMTGWWEASGEQVFTATEPTTTVARPREERKGRRQPSFAGVAASAVDTSDMQVGVATTPGPPGGERTQPVLPPEGHALAKRLLRDYRVGKGPAGVVLLFRAGSVIIPDQHAHIFGGYLQSPYRHALLRELRNAREAVELEEVRYTALPAKGYVSVAHNDGRTPGWYWRDGDGGERLICPRSGGVRFSALTERVRGWNMAINNSSATVRSVIGVVTSAEQVYPRARSGSDFELLVECPQNAAREVTLLLGTAEGQAASGVTGLALVSYRFTHSANGGVEMHTANREYHQPPNVVVFDTKGKARIFKCL